MQKKSVAILDIGSSKITVIVASRGINNSFRIFGMGEAEYSGFMNGNFLDYDSLKMAISMAITNAQKTLKNPITKIVVGMPAEFTYCTIGKAELVFDNKHKIQQLDLFELLDKGNASKNDNSSLLIKCTPVEYTIDSYKVVYEPIGARAKKISAEISYIFANKAIVEMINDYLKNIGLLTVEYMSSSFAEYKYLYRDDKSVLIDCGYLTTSISSGKRGILTDLKSFSLGGAQITGDLFEYFDVPFSIAETIKRNLILTLKPKMTDYYTVNEYKVTVKDANEVAMCRISQIAKVISKCLQTMPEQPYTIYLTGGGISYIRGIEEVLSSKLGCEVEVTAPPLPQHSKPYFSSALGLLNEVLLVEEKKKFSFLDFIKKR